MYTSNNVLCNTKLEVLTNTIENEALRWLDIYKNSAHMSILKQQNIIPSAIV